MTRDEFRPSAWLPGAHGQTIWGSLTRSRRLVPFRREVLTTPDDDELLLDHLDGPRDDLRVVLLHGLEGSSYSVYVQGMLLRLMRLGIPATAINFRSCGRDPRRLSRMIMNRQPRLYHSGETSDLDFVVKTLSGRSKTPLVAIGTSLGGNVLLKWLGENPEQRMIQAAVAISVPFDLGAGAVHLERGLGRIYVHRFLQSLRGKAVEIARRFELPRERLDVPAALRARTFIEFDDAATAPLHGFDGAEDYYRRSSSLGFIARIRTPALCISAQDDPFLPASSLERVRREKSETVTLLTTARGGHTGFISGAPWNCRYWAEETAIEWILSAAPQPTAAEPRLVAASDPGLIPVREG